VLDLASLAMAALAAYALAKVIARHLRLQDARMTELDAFAGRVAHDIRGPLTGVVLAVESVRRRPSSDDAARRLLDRATRSLQHVTQLVDGLLVFARAGSGQDESATAEVGPVVRGVLEDVRPAAEAKETSIEHLDPVRAACSAGVLIASCRTSSATPSSAWATRRSGVCKSAPSTPAARCASRSQTPDPACRQRSASASSTRT
jgi:signal transduction histidine kinase